jgi:hypothetical protein
VGEIGGYKLWSTTEVEQTSVSTNGVEYILSLPVPVKIVIVAFWHNTRIDDVGVGGKCGYKL